MKQAITEPNETVWNCKKNTVEWITRVSGHHHLNELFDMMKFNCKGMIDIKTSK